MRRRMRALALASAAAIGMVASMGAAAPAGPKASVTVPASGQFSFLLANGILPTWSSEGIVIIGVSPGSVTTSTSNLTARVMMPVVAKTGSAIALAGGFRLYNSRTGASVRCSTPTVDVRARVLDCVLPGGRNASLFAITGITSRGAVRGQSTTTWLYRGVTLRINGQEMSDFLNESLATTTFSPYVNVGVGDLVVTTDTP